ncbi:MAG TPA: hypothetical protein VGJ33_16190 [Candidatus Angelobacter sp.]|jgi:hypothetical protein
MNQYLLVVRNERGFPRFQLFKVETNLDVFDDPNFGTMNGGDTLSLQLTEPNGTSTFTVTATEP